MTMLGFCATAVKPPSCGAGGPAQSLSRQTRRGGRACPRRLAAKRLSEKGTLDGSRSASKKRLTAWIGTLDGGLTHKVGPGGSRLSGGQRRCLGVGRAILQRPRILILDEATSSLDAGSEKQLLSGLPNILPGSTIIVISHRLPAVLCVGKGDCS
jgi:ABC-type transport system involved in Fe-S cluster assembly fused permease/ATPase subunit